MLSRHGTGNNINIRVGFMASEKSGRHFADDIFKWIFANDNVWILIKISLMFAPKSSVPALVQIMAWFLPGDKPLSEPAMIRLPTHICVIRPQWVNKTFRWTIEWDVLPFNPGLSHAKDTLSSGNSIDGITDQIFTFWSFWHAFLTMDEEYFSTLNFSRNMVGLIHVW